MAIKSNFKRREEKNAVPHRMNLIVALLIIALVGLNIYQFVMAQNQVLPTIMTNTDKAFVYDFERGLEARWLYQDEYIKSHRPTSSDEETFRNELRTSIEIELAFIDKYKNASFMDATLQQYAVEYIDLLKKSVPKVVSYPAGGWDSVYMDRWHFISQFADEYNINMPSDYSENILREQIQKAKQTDSESQLKTEKELTDLINQRDVALAVNQHEFAKFDSGDPSFDRDAMYKSADDYDKAQAAIEKYDGKR